MLFCYPYCEPVCTSFMIMTIKSTHKDRINDATVLYDVRVFLWMHISTPMHISKCFSNGYMKFVVLFRKWVYKGALNVFHFTDI